MAESKRYPAQVFWSDEDEGFIALASDLPGCSAYGATQESAIEELQTAITAWIEAAEAAGNFVPSPSDMSAVPQFSGKTLTRMPKSLHGALVNEAAKESVSLNSLIVFILSSYMRRPAVHTQTAGCYFSAVIQPAAPMKVVSTGAGVGSWQGPSENPARLLAFVGDCPHG